MRIEPGSERELGKLKFLKYNQQVHRQKFHDMDLTFFFFFFFLNKILQPSVRKNLPSLPYKPLWVGNFNNLSPFQ